MTFLVSRRCDTLDEIHEGSFPQPTNSPLGVWPSEEKPDPPLYDELFSLRGLATTLTNLRLYDFSGARQPVFDGSTVFSHKMGEV